MCVKNLMTINPKEEPIVIVAIIIQDFQFSMELLNFNKKL